MGNENKSDGAVVDEQAYMETLTLHITPHIMHKCKISY
jgi:hypothetical protein